MRDLAVNMRVDGIDKFPPLEPVGRSKFFAKAEPVAIVDQKKVKGQPGGAIRGADKLNVGKDGGPFLGYFGKEVLACLYPEADYVVKIRQRSDR